MPELRDQEVPLPRVAELHRAIAMALVHKPARFLGAEVRYLRKYMGWSGVDFASRMGVNPETVSRWENEKEPISSTSDRLLRLIVVRGWPVEDYSVDDLVKIDDRRDPPPVHVELRVRITTGSPPRRSCRRFQGQHRLHPGRHAYPFALPQLRHRSAGGHVGFAGLQST